MPGASKRRKVAAAPRNASSAFNKPRGLSAFTSVSKASTIEKVIIEKNYAVDTIATSPLEKKLTTGSKRKAASSEEDLVSELLAPTVSERDIKPLPKRISKELPQTPQKPIARPITVESSTKGARTLLNHFFVSSQTIAKAASLELPAELIDLINLHAAFLTALSLHYAHNGTHAPADLRMLCPDVARAWGKRRVLVDDVRRTLGVLNAHLPENTKEAKLSLSDYGHGKICVEVQTEVGKKGHIIRPIHEDALNDVFVRGLRRAWDDREDTEIKVGEFIKGLPLEAIRLCSSFAKMSPLLAKGQRRLEDLKAGIIIRKEGAIEKTTIVESNGARATLLERLRAKQLLQKSLPPPPSKEELARKAALQRIGEIAGVLTMLSTSSSIGQQRISFTMPTVLGKLRDSFKTPMSKEEGDICLRLLAAEIAPNWVKIVKMGKVEALVVNRDERPTELDIKESVKRASPIL